MDNLVIETLKNKITRKTPIWLMRQAGRYMGEYRKIRSKFPDFIQMCKNSEAVTEITMQPIKEFDFDAAELDGGAVDFDVDAADFDFFELLLLHHLLLQLVL